MFTGSSAMSYENRRQLKCKFRACPCENCVSFREDRLASGCYNELADTPPERPPLKYAQQNASRGACKPYNIGPMYTRKFRSAARQRKQDTAADVKKCCSTETDVCNSGNGCCNTNGNFMSYMINVISFIAYVLLSNILDLDYNQTEHLFILGSFATIALLLFWLKMCEWTCALCVKTYHANRKTQLIVISIISFMLLSMICTYLMAGTTNELQKKHITSCQGTHCATETKEFTVTITDDKAREIYKQSKLYAIPLEMKQPPTLLLYLRKLILKDE